MIRIVLIYKETVSTLIGNGLDSSVLEIKKGEVTMIGSGENAIFVEAGVSPKKTKVLTLSNKKG